MSSRPPSVISSIGEKSQGLESQGEINNDIAGEINLAQYDPFNQWFNSIDYDDR